MKLSKKTWLVITSGIFVIALIGLGLLHYQQVQQHNQLNEELTLAQMKLNGFQLAQISDQQRELEDQLSQATSQFEAVKAMLSQPVGNIAASSILFDFAEAHELEVTEMTSSGPVTENLEEVTCSVISLTAKVEGDAHNLVSFIAKLNSHFTTGVVKSVEINIPETTDEGEEDGEEEEEGEEEGGEEIEGEGEEEIEGEEEEQEKKKASADIQLVVYTHPGD